MAVEQAEFLPWRKAFLKAGVKDIPSNPRGYWGHESGWGGLLVCSVWDDHIGGNGAKAYVPKVNKGNYRQAAEALPINSNVIVILRSRSTQLGNVFPTLWKVASKHFDQPTENSIGYLLLTNAAIPLPVD